MRNIGPFCRIYVADRVLGDGATNDALIDTMAGRPGLVFTASHGMAASPTMGWTCNSR